MTGLLYLLLCLAVIFIWLKRPRAAVLFYLATMLLAVGWFAHHMTDVIGLSL